MTSVDAIDLRKALGKFATGVTIVTTQGVGDQLVGVTANSFNTVSLSPPIVLWSLTKTSSTLSDFDHSGRFIINILSTDQVHLSQRFSKPISDKFENVEHSKGIAGLPYLHDCVARFECKTLHRHEVGDHILFLGQIEAYEHTHLEPLLFCKGQYAHSHALN
ncbi:MAG: flavin reductase family protein [Betaproteobacteria bacterium]|jgi:3-hydroxy-9,10-secoandrosta-1,3,5(10)-triene-9,17-dione monooxygenase reductase component